MRRSERLKKERQNTQLRRIMLRLRKRLKAGADVGSLNRYVYRAIAQTDLCVSQIFGYSTTNKQEFSDVIRGIASAGRKREAEKHRISMQPCWCSQCQHMRYPKMIFHLKNGWKPTCQTCGGDSIADPDVVTILAALDEEEE